MLLILSSYLFTPCEGEPSRAWEGGRSTKNQSPQQEGSLHIFRLVSAAIK